MTPQREEVTLWHELKAYLLLSPAERRTANIPLVKCPVCLDQNEIFTPATPAENRLNASPTVVLYCGHMICAGCFRGWQSHLEDRDDPETVTCPICRTDLCFTTNPYSEDGCHHTLYAVPLPDHTTVIWQPGDWHPNKMPLTRPEGGLVPNKCHWCRRESMEALARHIVQLRQDGLNDFQVRSTLLHTAGFALELTELEKKLAFPPNGGTGRKPWVAPPPGQERQYLIFMLNEEFRDEGVTWRGSGS
ncbi:hypothetical protein QBC40DRAFT_184765 [Triangularia verruculosa]|uniref:RING-type domain-containing protein n=1 Tax=Triangularia verruculosa TaxID=2587418 RepID=A0AAN6X8Y6_9PEZI|nr:hypothetical protein QBC40DRAFT_184765 [Triangularia verruculosa]